MNYSRFYALFRLLPSYGDDEGMKMQLVLDASGGRTTSLKELSQMEYDNLCHNLDLRVGRREHLRKARSSTLRLMQQLGIDTTNWTVVNAYCKQPRIVGKEFRYLDIEEQVQLQKKLRAILTKQNNHEKQK